MPEKTLIQTVKAQGPRRRAKIGSPKDTIKGKTHGNCYCCGKIGHIKRDCWAKKKTASNKKCSHCKKPGHEESKCWKNHPDQMPSWVKRKGQELAGLVMEEETAFMAFTGSVPVETV